LSWHGKPSKGGGTPEGSGGAIQEAGLRDQVKVMIGGGQMDEYVREHCGADAYGADAVAAVSLSKGWIGGK